MKLAKSNSIIGREANADAFSKCSIVNDAPYHRTQGFVVSVYKTRYVEDIRYTDPLFQGVIQEYHRLRRKGLMASKGPLVLYRICVIPKPKEVKVEEAV